ETRADFFMRDKLALSELCAAASHLSPIPRVVLDQIVHRFLREPVGIAADTGRDLLQVGFLVGAKMDAHKLDCGTIRPDVSTKTEDRALRHSFFSPMKPRF